jgi:hypothetical protein
MEKCQKCLPLLHLGEGIPLPPEILQGVADSFYATGWVNMLSSAELWGTLRRLPPKAFLIERVDAWLAFARRGGQYVASLEEDERAAAIEQRSAPFQRLRDLLIDWEPPVVTPEIREAARLLHISEFSRPPDEDWGRPDLTGVPIEATLVWPEGEWNEEAFVAGKTDGGREQLEIMSGGSCGPKKKTRPSQRLLFALPSATPNPLSCGGDAPT